MDIVEEYVKCYSDIPYYAENYCIAFDQTQNGFVPLKVFPRQKDLLGHFVSNRFSIVLKPRQAGVSTIGALFCAHKILFAPKSSPQKILIVANKRETAGEFLKKIKGYIETAPEWLGVTYAEGSNNQNLFELTNGSGAKAVGTSGDALRGYTPTLLVLDEAAFIEGADELWTSAAASLSTGGSALFISTPNGQDPLYYKTYSEALKGKNEFSIFDMFWWQDPRFNKDLKFNKAVTITNEETGKKEILTETVEARKLEDGTWDFDHVKYLISQKYEPTSGWFETMCLTYNGDERKIAQELKTVFSGSGDNVVKDEYIDIAEVTTCLPIETGFFDNNLWVWEDPKEGDQYLLGSDISRGDADDYSTIEIWNMTTGEQAAEWEGKAPPDVVGEMINEIGRKYQAYVVVDITGGLGSSTVIKLIDLEYPWLHYSEKGGAGNPILNRVKNHIKDGDKIPGFLISKNRTLMISALEAAIRNGDITIKSKRIIDQLRTFVYLNGRPDHLKGYHDDLLIALAMVLFTFQYSFKNVQAYNEQTKAMMKAMMNVKTDRPTFTEKVHNPYNQNNDTHGWLFG